MLLLDIDINDWLNKYQGLEIVKGKCPRCSRKAMTTLPFIEADWVGLVAPTCSCGRSDFLSVSLSKFNKEFDDLYLELLKYKK